jgi:hypothetical protein
VAVSTCGVTEPGTLSWKRPTFPRSTFAGRSWMGQTKAFFGYIFYRGPHFALVRIVIAVRGELRVEYLYSGLR